jgi:hypothetical protein
MTYLLTLKKPDQANYSRTGGIVFVRIMRNLNCVGRAEDAKVTHKSQKDVVHVLRDPSLWGLLDCVADSPGQTLKAGSFSLISPATIGLTIAEAKAIMESLQRQIVAEQVQRHGASIKSCSRSVLMHRPSVASTQVNRNESALRLQPLS